jgi:archaetidylinositol phosphate synthase
LFYLPAIAIMAENIIIGPEEKAFMATAFHGISQGTRELSFRPAVRIQQSIVSGPEKRTLIWLAKHTPSRINSDHLTALGFASQCFAGICYALARYRPHFLVLGIIFLGLNWLGDSLDGTLARFRDQQRPRYGFYVDHITDTFGAFALMGGLAFSGYVHFAIAIGMLVAFLMLSIESYLTTYTIGKFQLSYWKFGPTEIRILLAIGNLALLTHPTLRIAGHRMLLFDFGGSIAILGMSLMLVISAVRHTVQLYKEETVA